MSVTCSSAKAHACVLGPVSIQAMTAARTSLPHVLAPAFMRSQGPKVYSSACTCNDMRSRYEAHLQRCCSATWACQAENAEAAARFCRRCTARSRQPWSCTCVPAYTCGSQCQVRLLCRAVLQDSLRWTLCVCATPSSPADVLKGLPALELMLRGCTAETEEHFLFCCNLPGLSMLQVSLARAWTQFQV